MLSHQCAMSSSHRISPVSVCMCCLSHHHYHHHHKIPPAGVHNKVGPPSASGMTVAVNVRMASAWCLGRIPVVANYWLLITDQYW